MAAVFTVNQYWRPGDTGSLLTVFGQCVAAAVIFSLVSSSIYLINDVADIERDRLHPKKRFRPIAAGHLSPRLAIISAVVLAVGSVAAALALGVGFAAVCVIYLATQIAYSFQLKHEVLLDVFSIAAGFVLRVVGGAFAIGVPVSPWLYVCTTLGALFLALAKRRQELLLLEDGAEGHRKSLAEYSVSFVDQMLSVVTASTFIAYSLYTFSAENLPRNNAMMLTIPFVMYGFFRYLYLIHRKGMGGSPDEVLFSDRPLLIDLGLWVLTAVSVLYFSRGG